jgi:hypothetical protein
MKNDRASVFYTHAYHMTCTRGSEKDSLAAVAFLPWGLEMNPVRAVRFPFPLRGDYESAICLFS